MQTPVRKKVICHLLHVLRVGGAEVLAARLARQLRDHYDFVFVCLDELGSLADEPLRARLLRRGDEFAERAWRDLLRFPSRTAARPLAILMTEGTRDAFFRVRPLQPAPSSPQPSPFPPAEMFVPQKQRVKALLKSPHGLARSLLRYLFG